MDNPGVVSRAEWLTARKALLSKEKQATQQRDALSLERRRLPMVRIDKDYAFDGPTGSVRLLDLFEHQRQLIVSLYVRAELGRGLPELLVTRR